MTCKSCQIDLSHKPEKREHTPPKDVPVSAEMQKAVDHLKRSRDARNNKSRR